MLGRKKLVYLLVFSLVLVGCKSGGKQDFTREELGILDRIKNEEFGATSPRLIAAANKYGFILDKEGLVVYDLEEEAIKHLIPTKTLGFNNLQGSNMTVGFIRGDKLILSNLETRDRYLEIDPNKPSYKLSTNVDLNTYEGLKPYELTWKEEEKLREDMLDDFQAIETDNKIIIFTNDYKAEGKNWRIIVAEKNDLANPRVLEVLN